MPNLYCQHTTHRSWAYGCVPRTLFQAHVWQRAVCVRSCTRAHLPNTCPLCSDRDCMYKHAGQPELFDLRCNVMFSSVWPYSRGLPGGLLRAYALHNQLASTR
jgi:hypothetical protein